MTCLSIDYSEVPRDAEHAELIELREKYDMLLTAHSVALEAITDLEFEIKKYRGIIHGNV